VKAVATIARCCVAFSNDAWFCLPAQQIGQVNMKSIDIANPNRSPRLLHKPNLLLVVAAALLTLAAPGWAVGAGTRKAQQAKEAVPPVVMSTNYTDGQQFIAKMCSAADALDNYSSKYGMVVYKRRPPVTESGFFAFKKPKLMRVEVYNGSNKGALAILAKDGKVHGHLGGALRFFDSAVSPDSALVRAPNGFPMVDTDFYSLATYLQNMLKEGDLSRVTNKPMQTSHTTSPTYIVDMYMANSGTLLLLKRIYVDPQTSLPVYWEDYTNGKLWSESSWSDLRINVEFPDDYFGR
jgi:outer membrane lipoprotein-sorting protein